MRASPSASRSRSSRVALALGAVVCIAFLAWVLLRRDADRGPRVTAREEAPHSVVPVETAAPALAGRAQSPGSEVAAAPPPAGPGAASPGSREARLLVRLRLPDGREPERAAALVHGRIAMGYTWTRESPILTLPAGNVALTMRLETGDGLWRSATQALVLEPSDPPAEATFELLPVTCLRGRITWALGEGPWVGGVSSVLVEDEGAPGTDRLATSSLRAPIEGRADSGGTYRFEDLAPGRYLVGVLRATYGAVAVSREVYVPSEGATLDLTVPAVQPAAYVLVSVLDPDDRPVSDVSFQVGWEGPLSGGVGHAEALPASAEGGDLTPATGSWRLLRPEPARAAEAGTKWWIEARSPSFGVKRTAYDPVADRAVHIQYDFAPCGLDVQVVGEGVRRYAGRLFVRLNDEATRSSQPAAVDEKGVASLGGAQPGDYDLTVLLGNRPGRALVVQRVSLRSGPNPVLVTLPALHEITLEGADGMAIVTMTSGVSTRFAAGPAVDGRVLVDGLLAGEYRAQCGTKSAVFTIPGPGAVHLQ